MWLPPSGGRFSQISLDTAAADSSRSARAARDPGSCVPRLLRLQAMCAEWLIVLNADGTVLAVDGGAPLELVLDVIAAHGGAVQLESSTKADQSGTTVRLLIPCP